MLTNGCMAVKNIITVEYCTECGAANCISFIHDEDYGVLCIDCYNYITNIDLFYKQVE